MAPRAELPDDGARRAPRAQAHSGSGTSPRTRAGAFGPRVRVGSADEARGRRQFVGLHEWDVQCARFLVRGWVVGAGGLTRCAAGIGEAEWAFKTTFAASEDEVAAENADLVFDGLDTFAKVELVRIAPLSSLVFRVLILLRLERT